MTNGNSPDLPLEMLLDGAREVAQAITGQLDLTPSISTITLARNEALIALATIEAAIIQIEREQANKP